jgi:hypothetical protein
MGDTQTIAYISDVGAAELKPLFVAGCIITTIFLDLSFATDRWLRHKGRLVPNTTIGEKVLSGLTIFFALVGTVGLCFLSGFDTAHYPKLHDIFLLLFIAGYLLSAIFICWEYQRLGISMSTSISTIASWNIANHPISTENREHRVLRISFWVKLTFVLVELALAIAFAVTNFRKMYNIAAILEWVIAFIFSFYVFSFFIDLWPAVKTKRGMGFKTAGMAEHSPAQMEENYHNSGSNLSGNPRYTEDSTRPINNAGYQPRGANF